jgi:hypothetical protein
MMRLSTARRGARIWKWMVMGFLSALCLSVVVSKVPPMLMYREVAQVDGKAVAELVDGLVEELVDALHQVVVAAGETAPVFERGADVLDGKGRLIIRAGDVRAFHVGHTVWIEFDPYVVPPPAVGARRGVLCCESATAPHSGERPSAVEAKRAWHDKRAQRFPILGRGHLPWAPKGLSLGRGVIRERSGSPFWGLT